MKFVDLAGFTIFRSKGYDSLSAIPYQRVGEIRSLSDRAGASGAGGGVAGAERTARSASVIAPPGQAQIDPKRGTIRNNFWGLIALAIAGGRYVEHTDHRSRKHS